MAWLRSGRSGCSATIDYSPDEIKIAFGFNEVIKNEIKVMDYSRWNPTFKCWTVKNSHRNRFALDTLLGKYPIKRYDIPLEPYISHRESLFNHQNFIASHILTRKQCIVAAEMGSGKSLAAIEVLEELKLRLGSYEAWYCAPKVALLSVKMEFAKWHAGYYPVFHTYQEMTKRLAGWTTGLKPPRVVFFDESSKLKNPDAKMSQAALHLANAMRDTYGDDCYVVLMSGSPAPKSPCDWWMQCLPAGTPVLTTRGLVPIEQVGEERVLVNGRDYRCHAAVKSGTKPVFKIITDEGYSLEATADHRIMTEHGWLRVDQLRPGVKATLHNHQRAEWSGEGTEDEGYLVGLMIGDGYRGSIKLMGKKLDSIRVVKRALEAVRGPHHPEGFYSENCWIIESVKLERLFDRFCDSDKCLLQKQLSKNFLRGYLSGLFDTDCTIENGRLRITLSQTSLQRVKDAQRDLLLFGIPTRLRENHKEGGAGIIEGRVIQQETSHLLQLGGNSAKLFIETIGFRFLFRQTQANKVVLTKSQMTQGYETTINAVVSIGDKDVYDISVPGPKAFDASGFYVHNCEIACPGFLKEGTPRKFLDRVALVKKMVGESGVAWPKVITFKDDVNKCGVCGKFSENDIHMCDLFHQMNQSASTDIENQLHKFEPMVNEVETLYQRLKGLVVVILKKDCLDLPEKTWRKVKCKPTKYMMSMAKMVAKTSGSAANAITQLRELSDGIQYSEKVVGTRPCERCCNGTYLEPISETQMPCIYCAGKGTFDIKELDTLRVPTPKTQALIDELELSEDEGRIVIGAAFTGTIEDVVATVVKAGWRFIRRDGTGWSSDLGETDPATLIRMFQREIPCEYDKIAIIGHPKSISMGLTLHASIKIVCYSNSFDGEDRIQFLDRLHRPGCRGCEIVDFVHLPVDQLVLDNLEKKIKLQSVTMGQVLEALDSEEGEG